MASAYDDKQVVVPYVSGCRRAILVPRLRDSKVAYGDQRVLAKRFAKWVGNNCPIGFYNELKAAL